jgi:hypothetical protein
VKGLPDRGAADAHLVGESLLDEALSPLQLPMDDGAPEGFIDFLSEGFPLIAPNSADGIILFRTPPCRNFVYCIQKDTSLYVKGFKMSSNFLNSRILPE